MKSRRPTHHLLPNGPTKRTPITIRLSLVLAMTTLYTFTLGVASWGFSFSYLVRSCPRLPFQTGVSAAHERNGPYSVADYRHVIEHLINAACARPPYAGTMPSSVHEDLSESKPAGSAITSL